MEARQLNFDNQAWPAARRYRGAGLVLLISRQQFCVPRHQEQDFLIGRDPNCDAVLQWPFVSRIHARIRYQHQSFQLIDESSNGTYWRAEDGTLSYLHRKSARLWGNGELSFGEPLTEQSMVLFQTRD